MKKNVSIILLILIYTSLCAQEVVTYNGNEVLKNYSRKYFEKYGYRSSSDTLELPFFDDFSNSYIYPDSTKWADKFAFINDGYADSLVSIGVATLDALNERGEVYPTLPYGNSDVADFLTSLPINLEYTISDSLYLSFYYQCGGNGNIPELRDSLALQFYSVDNDEWKRVWSVNGGTSMHNFELVMVPIKDTIWLKKGFRFRFVNYASVSSNYEPSWQSNVDIWNIDFVMLDKNRNSNDTIINDVAMTKNLGHFLKEYSTIPWNHLKAYGARDIFNDSITFAYINHENSITHNVNRQYKVFNTRDNSGVYSNIDDSDNIHPLELIEYTKRFGYYYNTTDEDSAEFLIRANIKTDITQERSYLRWNDTVRYYQKFYNYYAYDDGTSERGYGITGQGTANSSLACQFKTYIADSLKGVYIYFNHTQNTGNVKYFYLTVWGDDNGKPGNILVKKMGVRPEFNGEINGFVYYPLDTAIYINDTFYIGWTKTTDDMLNCGLDINNDAHKHIFYNVSGEWEQSSISGAMMVRPVFGYEVRPSGDAITTETIKPECDIYPNPTTDKINITSELEISDVQIYDNLGKLVLHSHESTINVGHLPQGTYFVRIYSDRNIYNTKKIIIMR